MLLRLHQKIAPEWASNLVGIFENLSFARGSIVQVIIVRLLTSAQQFF
jgi:hypothetical protein